MPKCLTRNELFNLITNPSHSIHMETKVFVDWWAWVCFIQTLKSIYFGISVAHTHFTIFHQTFFFVRSLLSNTNIDQTNFFFHVYTFFFFVHLQIDKHLNDIGGAVVDTKNINISNRGIIIYSMFSEVARIKLTHWNQNYLIVIASVIHHLYILTAPNDWANIWECVASNFTNVLYHILIMIITRFFPSFFSSFFPSVSFYLFLFHYPYVFPINISLFAFWTVATNIWCHWHFEIEYV